MCTRHIFTKMYQIKWQNTLCNSVLCRNMPTPCIANLFMNSVKLYSENLENNGDCKKSNTSSTSEPDQTRPSFIPKYKVFQESDAPVILDVYEEKLQLENEVISNDDLHDEFYGINLNRGVQGVFDIEELVNLLKKEKAEDIFVVVVPPEVNYVDHIVIVSGKSKKHISALADFVRRVFKKKRLSTDIIPRIEGENSDDWMALDLGNIALHIFSRDARSVYDLESLWSVGSQFDPLVNMPEEPLIALLKKHAITINEINNKNKLL